MWLQVISIAVGIWLMMSPVVLPSNGQGAGVARIAGALAIWLGALALRDVTRPVRGLNALTGLFLVIAPWLVSNTHPLVLSSILAGGALIVLSLPRGDRKQQVGGGWWPLIHPELLDHLPAD